MKRTGFMLCFLLWGSMAVAQSFGSSPVKVTGTYDMNHLVYDTWLRQGTTGSVTMRFDLSAEGVDNALQMVQRMLLENGRTLYDPDLYNSFEENAELKNSPEALYDSLRMGNSKINEGWIIGDGSVLQLLMGSCNYEVSIINAYK